MKSFVTWFRLLHTNYMLRLNFGRYCFRSHVLVTFSLTSENAAGKKIPAVFEARFIDF